MTTATSTLSPERVSSSMAYFQTSRPWIEAVTSKNVLNGAECLSKCSISHIISQMALPHREKMSVLGILMEGYQAEI